MRKYCGNINLKDSGKRIIVYGWVTSLKNLGQLIFLILRDREGIIQVIISNKDIKLFNLAKTLTHESCIKITGTVKKKIYKSKNRDVEVLADSLEIINYSSPLPIDISIKNKEDTVLKYRYLYLRKNENLYPFKIRSKVILLINIFMQKHGFLYIETPFLTKSTPEGAKDYIIPSRINKRKFYALPQSPQLFKQILMISGIDRYYQIVKCFRDEDLRINRQPEFTQLDIEASFITSKELRKIMEKLIKFIWKKILLFNLPKFNLIKFKDSVIKYGDDKPDLRNPIIMGDFTNYLKRLKFNKLSTFLLKKKTLFFKIPCCNNIIDNNFLSFYKDYLHKRYNIKNIFWIKIHTNINKIESSNQDLIYNKFFLNKILKNKAVPKDVLFFLNGDTESFKRNFSKERTALGKKFNIINYNIDSFVWVINFPLFKKNFCNNKLESVHHPFTSPLNNNKNLKLLDKKPIKVISDSYDLIINGQELGGGSVRINNIDLQKKIFNLLNINNTVQKDKFGFFLESLKFGTPCHAGIAFGLDRLIMLLTKRKNIKDVIAFPKTNKGNCLLTNAPNKIEKEILSELFLTIK